MIHATSAANAQVIMRRGLLAAKAVGAQNTVWLCSPGLMIWAWGHVTRKHRIKSGRVVIFEVDIPRSWLRKGKKKGLRHTGGRDVPPDRIISVNFHESWKQDFMRKP